MPATARILTPMPRSRGLLSQSHDNEDLRPRTQGPEPSAARLGPSAARLGPRALSAGVVDSLGEGMERGILWIK